MPASEEMKDILDIKPPVEFQFPWKPVIVGSSILAGLILFLIVWKIIARTRNTKKLAPLTAKQKALAHLEKIDSTRSEIKKYYFSLSELLRLFLEEELKISALETTTEELLPHLKRLSALTPAQKNQLQLLLPHIDLVKFAAFTPSSDEISQTIEELKKFFLSFPDPETLST